MQSYSSRRDSDLSVKRGNYFELNLYTANQLLILRRELAKLLTNNSAAQFDARVTDLLFDVSGHNCDLNVIRSTLQSIGEADLPSCTSIVKD